MLPVRAEVKTEVSPTVFSAYRAPLGTTNGLRASNSREAYPHGRLLSVGSAAFSDGHLLLAETTIKATTLTSAYLNAAVGCLYGSFDVADLDLRLSWVGLDQTDESLLRRKSSPEVWAVRAPMAQLW